MDSRIPRLMNAPVSQQLKLPHTLPNTEGAGLFSSPGLGIPFYASSHQHHKTDLEVSRAPSTPYLLSQQTSPSWQTSPRSQLWPCSAAGFASLTPGGPVESMSPVHTQSQYKPVQPMWLSTPCLFRFSHRNRWFGQNFPSLLLLPKSPYLGLWGIFQPIWALWRPHSTLKQ